MNQSVELDKNYVGISLKQLFHALVFLGIFFIPFNSYQGIPALGEFAKESCALFFIGASVVLLIDSSKKGRLVVPYKNFLFQASLVLFFWFFIVTLLNIPSIHSYYFKQTSGYERMLRQFFVLFLSGILFVITFYNVFKDYGHLQLFYKIRRVFTWSLWIVGSYAFLEILILKLKMNVFHYPLSLYKYFPFTDVNLDYGHYRISSVTFEAPALATYLFTISGWMFSYILTGKGIKRFIPALVVVGLALVSDSRAGIFIMMFQCIGFGLLLIRKRRHHKILIAILGVLLLGAIGVGIFKGKEIAEYVVEKATSFDVRDGQHTISNRSRFGIQYASYQVFLEHPLTGVGYGMQAYEAKSKYPKWATVNNWEFRLKYLNEENKAFPPGYNIYTRLLAETGIVGALLFLIFLGLIFWTTYRIILKGDDRYLLAVVIYISMIGFFFNFLKMDSIRVFGFWVNFAILLTLTAGSRFVWKHSNKEIEQS